jgi:NADPH:quinone reductase-like Zn-dependent oxidoreductase
MQGTGMLVLSWPIVLGCDASGIVTELGEGVTKFKVGDKVFGCTRLGQTGYGTFQEFVSELNLNNEEESQPAY